MERIGFDLSHWTGTCDFAKAKAAGIYFMYTKATQGSNYLDDKFYTFYRDSQEFGILRGAYHFITFTVSGKLQAEYFWSKIKDDVGELRPVLDFEPISGAVTPSNAGAIARDFLDRFEELSGIAPGIYSNNSFWNQFGFPKDTYYLRFPFWYAYPTTAIIPNLPPPGPWNNWDIWQYSWSGDGKSYGTQELGVDLNRTTDEKLSKFILNPTGTTKMFETNALIAAFDRCGTANPVASIDFAALKAAGIDAALIDLGSSADVLNYDDPYSGKIDFENRMQRIADAKNAGLLALGNYHYSPVMDSLNYTGQWVKQHINWLTSGAGKPQGGLLLTCERYQWKEGTATKDCTPNMFVQDLKAVTSWLYNATGLVPGIRTARWFLDGSKVNLADGYLDVVNAVEDTLPLFMAYVHKAKDTVSGTFHNYLASFPDPAVAIVKNSVGVAVNLQSYFLNTGNTEWRGWECAWVYHPAVKDVAGNPALFRLIIWRGDKKSLYNYFNVAVPSDGGTTPPPPPPPTSTIEQRVTNIENALKAIKSALSNF